MRVLGLITEYNPFHFGHKYHLDKSMSITKSTHSLAVMSSSFVQRGEPSLVDKWTKAKMAIENGVDLVIELPFVYSCQSAELFAFGGVSMLNQMNIIDNISFGTELGEIEPLEKIAKVLVDEPVNYRESLKDHLSKGNSFSVSRSKAIEEYFTEDQPYSEILKGSNNILAIEYLKALYKLNSNIKPIAIKRLGKDYNDIAINSGFASATGIRNEIFANGMSDIEELLPKESLNVLEDYHRQYNVFNRLSNYNEIFNYLLISVDNSKLTKLFDMESGLENRFIQKGLSSNYIEKIIDEITTKRYPRTRIQRLFIHLLNNLDGKTIRELYNYPPQYIRVLGSNKKGFEILNKIKENSNISIITKYADYKKYNNDIIDQFLYFEEKATDIFFLGLKPEKPIVNMDYYKTPYFR